MADTGTPPRKVKIPKLNRPGRTWDFSLTLPGMISAVGAGVLALTFFFVMGILIGRGYRPEADVPTLNQIMPQAEHGQLAGELPLPTVLQAEELEYPERLKASPDKIMDAQPEEKPAPPPAVVQAPARPETPQAAQPAQQPAAPSAKQERTAPEPGEQIFDYTYQVASFREAGMARALADKLTAAGLRSGVESGDVNGSTWHRVQVFHQGTPASTDDMRAVLARFGIDKPLLKKKSAR